MKFVNKSGIYINVTNERKNMSLFPAYAALGKTNELLKDVEVERKLKTG